MKKKVILIIVFAAILIPAVLWASALIKCEILTQKYYDDFNTLPKANEKYNGFYL